MKSNWGKIFKDTSIKNGPVYAVGNSGFIDLSTGDFIHYDAAFSEETFDNEAFVEVSMNL